MTSQQKSIQIINLYQQRKIGYDQALRDLIAAGNHPSAAAEALDITNGGKDLLEPISTPEALLQHYMACGASVDEMQEYFKFHGLEMPSVPSDYRPR